MDKSIVVVNESRWIGDSVTSTMRPFESVVGVNLTSVDFDCANEEINSPAHEHFSIRGFVDGMRKKDPKVCLPFALEDGLPPLDVPTFRWWKCPNCTGWGTPELKLQTTQNNDGPTTLLFLHKQQTTDLAKNSDIGGDEAKNASSECDEVSGKRNSKSDTGGERSSKDQISCRLRDIPDLNQPFTETPSSNPQGNDLSLFKLLNACKAIICTNNQETEAHEAPYNMERRKRRARHQILNFPQTNGLGLGYTNIEGTRSAREGTPNSPTSLNAYTQGIGRRKLELGGPSSGASRGNVNVAPEVCRLNRNPADFSYPDAVNEFILSVQHLNPRKRKYL